MFNPTSESPHTQYCRRYSNDLAFSLICKNGLIWHHLLLSPFFPHDLMARHSVYRFLQHLVFSRELCLSIIVIVPTLVFAFLPQAVHVLDEMASKSSSPASSNPGTPRLGATDSGYSSATNSEIQLPEIYFTKPHLRFLNKQLQFLEPSEILRWAITTLPNLYQSTAFGLSGLVTLDILSKMKIPRPQMVDLIFIDTLYHFKETLDLVDRVQQRFPLVNLHTYRPDGVNTAQEFAEKYGDKLWETDDNRYDYLVKVEPAERAYRQLQVTAILTGRRRSQGGQRGDLDIIEVEESGLIKINPLANWSFQQIKEYVTENDVPYNSLLDQGYKSVGDWHSTQPVAENEDERSGRWKGQEKTECGIHNPRSKYAQYLMEQEKKRAEQVFEEALAKTSLEGM